MKSKLLTKNKNNNDKHNKYINDKNDILLHYEDQH